MSTQNSHGAHSSQGHSRCQKLTAHSSLSANCSNHQINHLLTTHPHADRSRSSQTARAVPIRATARRQPALGCSVVLSPAIRQTPPATRNHRHPFICQLIRSFVHPRRRSQRSHSTVRRRSRCHRSRCHSLPFGSGRAAARLGCRPSLRHHTPATKNRIEECLARLPQHSTAQPERTSGRERANELAALSCACIIRITWSLRRRRRR